MTEAIPTLPTPRPRFVTSPEVLACIQPMGLEHVAAVARLHYAQMGNSLWARLGTRFLVALYRGLLRDPSFLAYVYLEDGHVGGFIAGTEDASGLFGRTLVRNAWSLVLPTLLGLLRAPSVLFPLLTTPLYFGRSTVAPEVKTVPAESLFCSFETQLRGKRIAAHINKVLFDELHRRGHHAVKITTETDNAGANRQLQSMGFRACGTFRFYQKTMVTYLLDLQNSSMVG